MEAINEIRQAQRSKGTAAVLAIGTVTPPNFINQSEYADYYFRVTKSEHLKDLKENFQRICDDTNIRKRHFHLTEEMLEKHPKITSNKDQESLDARQDIVFGEVPKLGLEAAERAIKEWGQPKSKITHLLFHTTTGSIDMPGADRQMLRLLGLPPSTRRSMMYHQSCSGGNTVLRLAKDLAENSRGSRVLVICSEISLTAFRGPSESHGDTLLPQAIFGDGAAAVIVGADPDLTVERPLYDIIAARQTILPGTEDAYIGHIRQDGLTLQMSPPAPELVSSSIVNTLSEIVEPLGIIRNWNWAFWAVNPCFPTFLKQVETDLDLDKEKLKLTRDVLAEYGNMMSATIFFMLDEMRKQSAGEEKATVGSGSEYGILLGFGAGITMETTILRAYETATSQKDDAWTI
ncbi:Chalcone synthase-like protein [Rhynchospora pubera]|uniref:chalcone synthase n=1 Tax=Rhynchospora pubera TaxID=906938 RepID=A0AAV8HJS6_9POAL|nr:Chalcone synthase-like protein [Rhynchospora pubera]